MQFGFTEAQEMFRTQMQTFVQREIAPGAKERAKLNFPPPEIVQKLVDIGVTELCLPEKYGGQLDWIILGIAVEEIAKGDIMAAQLTVQISLLPLICSNLTEEVKREKDPADITGELLYEVATTLEISFEGYPPMGYSAIKRVLLPYTKVYEYSALAGDVHSVSNWITIPGLS